MPSIRLPKFKLPNLKDPKQKYIFTLYFGVAVIAVLFLTAIGIPMASNPKMCNACHSNKPNYESWQKSSHANVTCYSCHINKGLANLLMEKAKVAITGPYNEFIVGVKEPINHNNEYALELPRENCERCHNLSTRKVTPTEGIKIDHQKHLDRGINCTKCHNRIAHLAMDEDPSITPYEKGENKTFKYANFMKMETGCFRCHTRNQESAFLEEFPEGKGAPTACTTCHPADWKGLPEGHGGAWRANHRFTVEAKGKGYCLSCHNEKEFCSSCHDEGTI